MNIIYTSGEGLEREHSKTDSVGVRCYTIVEFWSESQFFVKRALVYDSGVINNCQYVEWLFCAPYCFKCFPCIKPMCVLTKWNWGIENKKHMWKWSNRIYKQVENKL